MLRRMLPNFGKLAMGASRSRGAISQLLHPCTMESQLECECDQKQWSRPTRFASEAARSRLTLARIVRANFRLSG